MAQRTKINRLFSVAPMMAWTDRHCRYFHRLISPDALLYTVMITSGALKHGDVPFHLNFDDTHEHPVALQLGGSDPAEMAYAAKLGQDWGYDEININCGCPSERVQKGAFGACLMAEPDLVADCVRAMKQECDIDITVKTRIGIDNQDSYEFLTDLIGKSADAGCESFTIHARKAWLKGLSPKENRDIPPLDYDRVYRLKRDFPHLEIVINGGILTIEDMQTHLTHVDGVMVGREAYHNPMIMHDVQSTLFGKPQHDLTRLKLAEMMTAYAEKQTALGVPLKDITKHLLGLYQACPGAREWRRTLTTHVIQENAQPDIIYNAALKVEDEIKSRQFVAA